jgi:hypothetical protein
MSDSYTPFGPLRYDPQQVAAQGYGIAASGPTDAQMMVGFYRRSVLNRVKSIEQGTPVYEAKDYVKIQHPGETLNVVDCEANDSHKRRWSQRWEQYQKGINQEPDGMPLSLLFPAQPEVEATLRGYNIHTVQQLAHLSGHGISTVGMGCQAWVNAANVYLERAEKGVDHHKFEAAMAQKDTEIRSLKRQISELSQLVQQRLAQTAPTPQNFDYQTAQINQTHASADDSQALLQAPAQFIQDLSGSVQTPKRRGRPPKNKESTP